MDKVEKILQRYKIYLGVRDVAVEIRPYKTRTAFTNLASSPPTIYLIKHLIDDEEVLDYLILRDMIHIKLHMYLPMRYTGGLSYAEKFDSALNFFLPKEKVEEIREKMEKLIEVNRRLQRPLFPPFYGASQRRLLLRGELLRRDKDKRKRKKRLIRLQVHPYRDFLTGIITLVSLYLQGKTCSCWLLRPFRHTTGRPLRPAPRGISRQVFLWVCSCQSLPVERRLIWQCKKKRYG